jgi:hypothetical protein
MVRAQHPLLVWQQLLEQLKGLARVTPLRDAPSDVAPGEEGVGMVRAKHPLPILCRSNTRLSG